MSTNPRPGAVPPNELPSDARVHWSIRADGKVIPVPALGDYETVAASTGPQALGATGAVGDYLDHIIIVPSSLSPGAVTIKDGANGAITIFAGGATSLATLAPIDIPVRAFSTNGAWQITNGAGVTSIGFGSFT